MPETRRSVCALDCPDACSILVTVENGQAISSLDAEQLMALDEWEQKQYEERQAARRAQRAAELERRKADASTK